MGSPFDVWIPLSVTIHMIFHSWVDGFLWSCYDRVPPRDLPFVLPRGFNFIIYKVLLLNKFMFSVFFLIFIGSLCIRLGCVVLVVGRSNEPLCIGIS